MNICMVVDVSIEVDMFFIVTAVAIAIDAVFADTVVIASRCCLYSSSGHWFVIIMACAVVIAMP